MERYEDRLLAFVDILGFKELINLTVVDERQFDELAGLYHLWENLKQSAHRVQATMVSDTICISGPPSAIGAFAAGVSAFCVAMIMDGHLLRGAIVRGLLYHPSPSIMFGPSVVRAAALEKLAKMPRVIIDESVLDIPEAQRLIGTGIKRDHNFHFLNFLDCEFIEPLRRGNTTAMRESFEWALGSQIANLYERNRLNSEIESKYWWLVDYFNLSFPQLRLTVTRTIHY